MPSDPQQLREWLLAAGRHDAAAFRSLYDAAAPKLFGYALRILRKRELAEEALQEGFVSIWHSASGYQSALSGPMTWMTAIVRNKALDILRRLDEPVEMDTDFMHALADSHGTPEDGLQLNAQARALDACLSTLEGTHRQVIGMAFFHDLTHSEVAQRMSLPIGTVKTWIRRGLERLKTCLSQRGQT